MTARPEKTKVAQQWTPRTKFDFTPLCTYEGKVKRGLIMVRVSSQAQVNDGSPRSQERALRAIAERMGIPVKEDDIIRYCESAHKGKRVIYNKTLDRIAAHYLEYSDVFVADITRMGRQGSLTDCEVQELEFKYGIHVHSIDHPYPAANVAARRARSDAFLNAWQDSADKKARKPGQMADAMMDGKWMGHPPVGYKHAVDRVTGEVLKGRLIVDQHAKKVFNEARRMYLSGKFSDAEVEQFVFDKGVLFPPRRKRSERDGRIVADNVVMLPARRIKQLRRILTSPIRWGEMNSGNRIKNDDHTLAETIFTREEGLELKALFDGKGASSVPLSTRLQVEHEALLKGILRCGDCGSKKMSWTTPRGKSGIVPQYHCLDCLRRRRKKEPDAPRAQVNAKRVEAEYRERIKQVKPTKEAVATFGDTCVSFFKGFLEKHLAVQEEVLAMLNALDKQESEAIAKCADGKIEAETLEAIRKELKRRRVELQPKIDAAADPGFVDFVMEAVNAAYELYPDVDFWLDSGDWETQQWIMRHITPNGVAYRKNTNEFSEFEVSELFAATAKAKPRSGKAKRSAAKKEGDSMKNRQPQAEKPFEPLYLTAANALAEQEEENFKWRTCRDSNPKPSDP